jgi:hypothetical protein
VTWWKTILADAIAARPREMTATFMAPKEALRNVNLEFSVLLLSSQKADLTTARAIFCFTVLKEEVIERETKYWRAAWFLLCLPWALSR